MTRHGRGPAPEAKTDLQVYRLSTAAADQAPVNPVKETISLPVEAPLTVEVKGVGAFTIMASPGDEMALAAGFALAEGLIASRDDILILQHCQDDRRVVRLQVAQPKDYGGRNMAVMSSCGLCGSQGVDQVIAGLPPVGRSLQVTAAVLGEVQARMSQLQPLYRATGGSHAALLFDARGQAVSWAEDIGRHSALDKAVGKCLLDDRPTAGLGVALSGRVSLEMVVKAARAGLELIAAVSSPTSLAVRAAEARGLTVCGFVRQDRATVYSRPWRVLDLAGEA